MLIIRIAASAAIARRSESEAVAPIARTRAISRSILSRSSPLAPGSSSGDPSSSSAVSRSSTVSCSSAASSSPIDVAVGSPPGFMASPGHACASIAARTRLIPCSSPRNSSASSSSPPDAMTATASYPFSTAQSSAASALDANSASMAPLVGYLHTSILISGDQEYSLASHHPVTFANDPSLVGSNTATTASGRSPNASSPAASSSGSVCTVAATSTV
mmetsp:Transcript_14100/g.59662  ORF Transcript_14100/g.59662 Transcript_14100/m.59662 type:complete len:218 (-) Transcript_14100:33-686(-)